MGADIRFRLSKDAAAFTVWTVPSTAFMVMTAKMTIMLSTSPSMADTAAARIRMMTRKSANCSRKMRGILFRVPVCSSLEPYRFSRSAAWAEVSPSSPQSSSRNSSVRSFSQSAFSFITDLPFQAGRKKARPSRQCPALMQKSRHFNPKRGQTRIDACGCTVCASYSLLLQGILRQFAQKVNRISR